MVGWYSSHTSKIHLRVRPLLMPIKKLVVKPAITESTIGTTRKAHTSKVKESCA